MAAGRTEACGGGVTSALKAWPHLLEAVGRTIDELDMYSPSVSLTGKPFAVYSRITFDTFLRERAQTGAKVFAEKVSARGFSGEERSLGGIARSHRYRSGF
jgi:hypothetical protein